MFDTDRVPSGRQDLDLHATPALAAETGWFQAAGASAVGVIVALVQSAAAPIAPQRRRHSVADSALTGIDNSANRARSSLAGRPRVVR